MRPKWQFIEVPLSKCHSGQASLYSTTRSAQRRAPVPSLAAIARKHCDRDEAIVTAYGTGVYSFREIAERFQLHLATVGRIIRAWLLQYEN